jgi:transposase
MGRPPERPAYLPEDHHCGWRAYAEHLEKRLEEAHERIDKLESELEILKRHVFGRRSEKMPTIASELRVGEAIPPDETAARRRERARVRHELPARTIRHEIPPEQRRCPRCGRSDQLRPLGSGKTSIVFEHIPERFERQIHVQETLACRCGEIVTAEKRGTVVDKGRYGPGLLAHLVVAKCGDSIPMYRLEKSYQRMGIPLARSTMIEQFHRTGELLAPLANRIIELIGQADIVLADETPIRIQAPVKTRLGYLWTFVAEIEDGADLIGYRFSASRSGATPAAVLGSSTGALVVDAYTGYNRVTTPDGRTRVACWAHVRRRFFEARSTAPEAEQILHLIRELYRVEHDMRAAGVVATEVHRRARLERSQAVLDEIGAWLEREEARHPPQGLLGTAIRYTRRQWPALIRFVADPRLPLDNNASERALRVAALGRKNFLFVGSDAAGDRIAGLYAIVATCEANGVNPREYLVDVLLRIQDHPRSRIDDLLPHRWRALHAGDTS